MTTRIAKGAIVNKRAAVLATLLGPLLLALGANAAEAPPLGPDGRPLSGMPAAEAHVARMDPDRDGRISLAENTSDAKTTFARLDADADGKITATETSAGRLAVMDTNKDGSVSLEEFVAASQATFAKMDLDHDGYLIPAEILAAHNAAQAQKPQQP